MILKHLANSKILYVALICGCFCQTQAQEQSIASKEDCLKNGLNCSSDAVCSSMTNGSYVTYICSCKSGFNGDGFRCYDIDECAAQGIGIGSPCPLEKNQVCVNSIGSYRCVCASYARNASYFKDCRSIAKFNTHFVL
ncbi:uncharacterized protein TRIADDRAFT_62271 [Trichoplax adhaerens]|uniref:EGF-like domain-containing protein n=1 Tax=Trichoplax adhaerens TaxID=10228 RepID=B3SDB3_TRIAD|nr:hypothetical protein TRIADDRAFT_62271 [Trichoplax adhaerens]EDV19289.1 hypothetical protein TRIADDRAFT_62271 [Trichoplax adhaerens]|eukprot:XP_002118213.1 hypothetical protein TRIADDRAFT_62271 [Trichoplax adhaerens]